ncbi:MAG: hypothetical protein HZC28_20110 [Spirochaetes bacterium]|nr:hypothetical protein [Spirochaetota bacterium]
MTAHTVTAPSPAGKKGISIGGFLVSFVIVTLSLFILFFSVRFVVGALMPSRNPVVVFLHDYLDLMNNTIGETLSKYAGVKHGTVATYQLNLVKQSLTDYLGVIKYQQDELMAERPLSEKAIASLADDEIETLKRKFYVMGMDNPYLKSLTFFSMSGDMTLHLYREKGWNIKLKESIIKEVKAKKTMTLHSTTENVLYCLTYYKTAGDEFIVSTRTDKNFIYDIVSYYQLADRRFYIADDHNVNKMIVREGDAAKRYNVISIIGKYAKSARATFGVPGVPNLNVSMNGSSSLWLEIAILFVTALIIAFIQVLIAGAIKAAGRKHTPELPVSSGGGAKETVQIRLSSGDTPDAEPKAAGDTTRVRRHRIFFDDAAPALVPAAASAEQPAASAVVKPVSKKPVTSFDGDTAEALASMNSVFEKFDEALKRMVDRESIITGTQGENLANARKSDTMKERFSTKPNDAMKLGNA